MRFTTSKRKVALHACRPVISLKIRQKLLKKLVVAVTIYLLTTEPKRTYSVKRFWVNPIFALRKKNGFYHTTFQVMLQQEEDFRNYLRMDIDQYYELLELIAPRIVKRKICRAPISPGERLVLTLRFVLQKN